MALDFPNSPVAGTVFGAWRYDGTKWGAVSGVSGGGSAGDITAVLAGAGLSGGGTEGDVSVALAVPVTVARGGTGATDAAGARTSLGAAPNPVNLTSQVTGVLPVANGGSGSSTAAAAPWVEVGGDTMTGGLAIQPPSGSSVLALRKSGSGQIAALTGEVGTLVRWGVQLGDISPESGSNQGSNFLISRYNDAGTLLDSPLSIARATGAVSLKGASTGTAAAAGEVGEYVEVFGNTASPGSSAGFVVTSMALSAGDWDVWGLVAWNGDVNATQLQAAVVANSATMPSYGTSGMIWLVSMTIGGSSQFAIPPIGMSLSAAGTVYMPGMAVWSGGSQHNVGGRIMARRRR